MAALQARAFGDAGWTVLQIDLAGCGDSAGDFSDATWARWIEEVVEAAAWLRERHPGELVLWGLRAGALLAAVAAQRIGASAGLVLWQPVVSGKQHLQQFLRLKAAASMVAQTDAQRVGPRELREQLGRGEHVEIAGYSLSPGLALGLEEAELDLTVPPMRVAWLEVAAAAGANLAPASHARIQRWQNLGHEVQARAVEGPLFWQTLNVTEAPALIDATLAAVQAW